MYIYKGKVISNPICIHFLCGNKYSKSLSDKRNVLLEYINSLNNNYALILEKLFKVKEYSKIGFKDLEEVELMTSYYASSIIILHETISTGAEIALFGSRKNLRNKILVVHAPRDIIKTDNVGGFLKFAYFDSEKVYKECYEFYSVHKKFEDNVEYYETYFPNDEIDDEFKGILCNFWNNSYKEPNLFFNKNRYNMHYINEYIIDNKSKKITIKLSYEFILGFVISCMLNNKIKSDIRDKDTCVSKLCSLMKDILINTIERYDYIDINGYTVNIKTNNGIDINIPIRFCIYILEGIEFINFRDNKLSFSRRFNEELSEYKDLIKEVDDVKFFDGDSNE